MSERRKPLLERDITAVRALIEARNGAYARYALARKAAADPFARNKPAKLAKLETVAQAYCLAEDELTLALFEPERHGEHDPVKVLVERHRLPQARILELLEARLEVLRLREERRQRQLEKARRYGRTYRERRRAEIQALWEAAGQQARERAA
jgi:hypothetical protein